MRRRRPPFAPGAVLVAAAWSAALGCAASPPASGSGGAEPTAPVPGPESAAPAAEAQPSAEHDPDALVQVSLLADTTAVAPGQTFTLAARFDIAPGWHLYWENPGESGLATEVGFTAPAGFAIGPVRYPGPISFTSPGPVTSYGYADRVLLSAEARAPAELPPPAGAGGSARFEAEAFWLACREVCVRGAATTSLELPAADPAAPAPSAHRELLRAHAARVPRPLTDLAGATHAWEPGADGPVLVLRAPATAPLTFFPDADSQLVLAGQDPGREGDTRLLRVRTRASPARLGGVLAVGEGAGAAFYRVDVPVPPADELGDGS